MENMQSQTALEKQHLEHIVAIAKKQMQEAIDANIEAKEKIIEEGNRFREENEVVLSQEQDRIRIQEIDKVRVEVKNSD